MKKNILILLLFAMVQISFCQTGTSKQVRKVTASGNPAEGIDVPELAIIRPEVKTNFVHAGWKEKAWRDRYPDMSSLDANKTMTVADLKGPGIIRHIHFTRHCPDVYNVSDELTARGVVLEIWFDDATEPAVQCPLADFFGDGCNGQSMDFSTPLIECAPWSYNCYFPMPFKSRARVLLRNDTDKNLGDYSYVEWESLPKWDDHLGYFHATYQRKCFQLTKNSDETFFEIEGTGHLLGRQYSIVTDEPHFRDFSFVMEGNNEVDIDGQSRKLDYLGSEDSFTFSWGFEQPFVGLHAGMTFLNLDLPSMVSIYRFHDHQPIRFNKSLRWHINWSYDGGGPAALAKDRFWVDYATVYYWFQTVPGGYSHQSLPPVAERMKPILHPNLVTDK